MGMMRCFFFRNPDWSLHYALRFFYFAEKLKFIRLLWNAIGEMVVRRTEILFCAEYPPSEKPAL